MATGLVMYIVATHKSRRVSLIALAACVAAIVLSFALTPMDKIVFPQSYDPPGYAFLIESVSPVAVQCAAWALGFAVRRQRGYIAAVRAQAEDQMRVQREQSWRTATEERLRIARELHDVVAHGMSVITVQAGVGGHLLDERPEQARAALAVIETTGREALRELRQLLGVLREDGAEAARAPAPRIADLDDVVRRVRQAGIVVDLDVRGERRALSGGVELSAYRIVQEALTNVVKHAHTDRCRVRLTYREDALGIEVTDDGAGAGPRGREPGHGIVGMRERAALHGGTFEAGPLPLRGYRIEAGIPLGGGVA
ncbi:MAG: sensor histidine kinase [Actinocrinis sp.]